MHVKLKTSLSGPSGSYSVGDEYPCDESEAKRLIAAGFAEPCEGKTVKTPAAKKKAAKRNTQTEKTVKTPAGAETAVK